MSMIKKIRKNKELSHGILMSVLLVMILRIFYSVPTPGVNTEYLKFYASFNQMLGFANILSGSGLSRLSLMTLNITPYITASIIMQLLGVVSKKIKDMSEGMKDERKRLENITVVLTGFLAMVESVGIALGFGSQNMLIDNKWYWVLIVALIWTAGAIGATLVGKFIQEKYKFNGISLILLLNILSAYPSDFQTLYLTVMNGKAWWLQVIIGIAVVALILALFVFAYYLQEAEKELIVNYSGKSIGQMKNKAVFPLKLCQGGVIPIIFASSAMSFPLMIAAIFSTKEALWMKILNNSYWFRINDPLPTVGVLIYIVMIFGFAYFYNDISMNPYEISENIKKSGGTIPGIRAGKSTEEYISKHMKSLIALGAAGLTIIALVPLILGGLFGLGRISFLGTSIIIIVGVIYELQKTVDAATKADVYIERNKVKGGLF